VFHCTVATIVTAAQSIVVTVIRGEHHSIMVTEPITSVARVAGYMQPVVVGLALYGERIVLLVVPAEIACLHVTSHLVAASLRQLTEQVVAEPVVAARVIESDFKLRPRTIEEVRTVNILLDQNWNAVGCKTYGHWVKQSVKQVRKNIYCRLLSPCLFKTKHSMHSISYYCITNYTL